MNRHYQDLYFTEELPHLSQELRLTCANCNTTEVYDVGCMGISDEKSTPENVIYPLTYSNYFHCTGCGGFGPFLPVMDELNRLIEQELKNHEQRIFIPAGQKLYDGTRIQSPAMGEAFLQARIKAHPNDAFLHSRLGNLLHRFHQDDRAAECYHQTLALNPGDAESGFHLFCYQMDKEDFPGAIKSLRMVCRELMAGSDVSQPQLMANVARGVIDFLSQAPKEFEDHFLSPEFANSQSVEDIFIRSLLAGKGKTDRAKDEAYARLTESIPADLLDSDNTAMKNPPSLLADLLDLAPSLKALVEQAGLDPLCLWVEIPAHAGTKDSPFDKHQILLSDGLKQAHWSVPNLRDLFRGDTKPPADLPQFPPKYVPHFATIEQPLLELCDDIGDRSDQEMEEVFSALRRRPDGRSIGFTHDCVWQAAALLAGMTPVSAAEFEGLFDALTGSARRWGLRPISRNYLDFLRQGDNQDCP